MKLIFPDAGLVEQLARILGGSVVYQLYDNDVTPTDLSVLGDFSLAGWPTPGSFTLGNIDYTLRGVAAHAGYAIAPPIAFLNSTGMDQVAYGYRVLDTGLTILLAAARFDGAPLTIHDGDSLTVVPVWGDFSQYTS